LRVLGGPLVDLERDFTNTISLLVTVFLSSALVLPFSSALLLLPPSPIPQAIPRAGEQVQGDVFAESDNKR